MNSIASWPNERSFSAVLDLGIDKRPFEDNLSGRLWAVDIGSNRLAICVKFRLFSALQVKMALL